MGLPDRGAMAARFAAIGPPPPAHISAEPQKEQPPEKALQPGLTQRTFTDAELRTAFTTFDLDKNSFVGASELATMLQLAGVPATDREIDEMIRLGDRAGDGQVAFEEFHKLLSQSQAAPPPVPRTKRAVAAAARSKASKSKATTDYQARATQGQVKVYEQPGQGTALTTGGPKGKSEAPTRGMTVEMLVKKLSGGLGKIKPSQIKKVYKRFQEIDTDQSGAIEYEEFIVALEMEDTSVARQMFRVFDMDGSGRIELKEFIVVLSRYTSAAQSEKMKFAFMMFDEDGSGVIERHELVQMLGSTFVVEGYSPDELEDRADMVFNFLGKEKDDIITYEDFGKLTASKNGLIYPVEEERHALGGGVSINALLAEAKQTDANSPRFSDNARGSVREV